MTSLDPKLRDAALRELLERYQRIRDERRGLIKMLMGFSGSAIILSITFLDKLAPQKRGLPLVVLAWLAFAGALLLGIATLVHFTRISTQYQRQLVEQFDSYNRMIDPEPFAGHFVNGMQSGSAYRLSSIELVIAAIALVGALFFGAFAIVNVWA